MTPIDPDDRVSLLASRLDPADREPFRVAAEAALAALPPGSAGPGSAYRTITPIWRAFFHPPRDQTHPTSWGASGFRGSKMIRNGDGL